MVEISIRTRSSEYLFQVSEPGQCRGFLSGGRLGNQPHAVMLAGTIPPTNQPVTECPRLESGRRAIFFIDADGFDLLTTSVITMVTHVLVPKTTFEPS